MMLEEWHCSEQRSAAVWRAASQRRSLLYPKLFISNGIVTRVSVWYLTFRDTRTLGELLFGDKEKGAAHS